MLVLRVEVELVVDELPRCRVLFAGYGEVVLILPSEYGLRKALA